METEYAEIDGLPYYRFGSDGSIQSRWVRGSKRGRVADQWSAIKGRINKRLGYEYTSLKTPEGKRHFRVNVLILWAFTGHRPSGMDACHKNGKRTDNRLENLEWKTHAENIADKHVHGTVRRGVDAPNAILDPGKVREIRGLFGVVSYAEIGRRFMINEATVRAIASGRNWSHVA